jgi:hypothetical protein
MLADAAKMRSEAASDKANAAKLKADMECARQDIAFRIRKEKWTNMSAAGPLISNFFLIPLMTGASVCLFLNPESALSPEREFSSRRRSIG